MSKMVNKSEEGSECVKEAEKCLKTSFLRWKPDYDLAADKYEKAALCFKVTKEFGKSKDCFLKAAHCYQQKSALFHAAKCLDQVILLSKDLNDYENVSDLGFRASHLFLQYGSPEAAVSSLEKAGKVIETHKPEHSVMLYQKAADVLQNEDNNKQAADFLNRSTRLMIRLKVFDKVVSNMLHEMELRVKEENYGPVGRLVVGLVLVYLALDDAIAAEKAFREWGGYCEPPERENLGTLIDAFLEEDSDTVKQCLNHPFIMHMDVEFSKLAKSLQIPKPQPEPKNENAMKLESDMAVYKKELEETNKEARRMSAGGEEDGRGKKEEVDDEEEGLC